MTKDLADELEWLAKEIEDALADHDADAAATAASARAILSAFRGEQWQGTGCGKL